MKKFLVSFLLFLSMTSILTGCGCKKKVKEKTKVKFNTNENVVKDQKVDVFEFINTSLKYEDGTTVLETTVTNTSDEPQHLKEFKIHVKNGDNEDVIELVGFVGSVLNAGESQIINSYCGEDLTKAKSIEYEVVK